MLQTGIYNFIKFYWTLLLFNDSYHYTMVLLQYTIIVKVYTFVNFVQ